MLLRELLKESLKHVVFQDKNEKWYIKDGRGIKMKQYGEFDSKEEAELECEAINSEDSYDDIEDRHLVYSKKQMKQND